MINIRLGQLLVERGNASWWDVTDIIGEYVHIESDQGRIILRESIHINDIRFRFNVDHLAERSILVELMLKNGFKLILCEIEDNDKKYLKDGEEVPRFIIHKHEDGLFIDVDGNMWQSVQPIKPNGDLMTYKDYLLIRDLTLTDS